MYQNSNNNGHYFWLFVSIVVGPFFFIPISSAQEGAIGDDKVTFNLIENKLDHLINSSAENYSHNDHSRSMSIWPGGENDDGDFLETWKAPYEIRSQYPYYLAGHDYENRPVWIIEVGKWNYRKMVESGEETLAIFDMYIKQAIYRMTKSFQNLGPPDDPVTGITLISDMDEFSYLQMAHVPTVAYLLKMMRTYRDWFIEHLDLAICLNTNAVAHSFINLARPVLGRVMERVEVFGTQRSRWQSRVLQHIPPSQLPAWYGGRSNFKPIKVYG